MESNLSTTKAMGLLAQVTKGLLLHSQHATQSMLGDRKSYIGMSDIGKATECMRSAVAGKVNGNNNPDAKDVVKWFSDQDYEKVQSTLKKQLILQRGHWLESGIMQAFKANKANVIPQLEICIDLDGVPIKPHLDFVLVWGKPKPAVRILELKSTEKIPSSLYSSYETQLYGQLGFLEKYWNEPCFGVKDDNGKNLYSKMTFPQLVKQLFNIEVPVNSEHVDIEGWVLCLAMSDFKAFGPYKPNRIMIDYCEQTAKSIWNNVAEVNAGKMDLNGIDYCKSFHPLCDWCSHIEGCPKFTMVELQDPAYADVLDDLEQMKQQKDDLEANIKMAERRIGHFYQSSGLRKEWLTTGDYRFKCSNVKGRFSLNQQLLKEELINILGDDKANALITKCSNIGSPYKRLQITKQKS